MIGRGSGFVIGLAKTAFEGQPKVPDRATSRRNRSRVGAACLIDGTSSARQLAFHRP